MPRFLTYPQKVKRGLIEIAQIDYKKNFTKSV